MPSYGMWVAYSWSTLNIGRQTWESGQLYRGSSSRGSKSCVPGGLPLGPPPGSNGTLPVTARRAKRENGGLGEDPPGSTITYLSYSGAVLSLLSWGYLPPFLGSLRSGVCMPPIRSSANAEESLTPLLHIVGRLLTLFLFDSIGTISWSHI
jgi:hypothetical protein